MKCVVSLSGGRDSSTCLGLAVEKYGAENVFAIGFEYGSKHPQELESAKKIADYYGVNHILLNLIEVFKYSNCPLLSKSSKDIKHQSYAKQIEENGEGMVETYVPFRNGLMLSAVATYAMSVCNENDRIIYINK